MACVDTLALDGLASTPLAHVPTAKVAGDFNRDGKLDVALTSSVSGVVSVLIGNGDGTFQPGIDYAAPDSLWAIAAADFDGDSVLDLLVEHRSPSGVSVLLGRGDGSFGAPIVTTVGSDPYAMVVGDFDDDGNEDGVIADPVAGVEVLLGHGDGSFTEASVLPIGVPRLSSGDLNGDGYLDLVAVDGGAQVLMNRGDGTFAVGGNYPTADGVYSVAVVDLDNDGRLDLAASGACPNEDPHGATLLGNGDGTFRAPVECAVWSGCDLTLAAGDVNGDGNVDLVPDQVLLGNGDGTLVAVSALPGPVDLVADFTGDGKLDVLSVADGASLSQSRALVFPGIGDGSFGVSPGQPAPCPSTLDPWSMALADLDGDGVLDMAVGCEGPSADGAGALSIERGSGDGNFAPGKAYTLDSSARSLAVGDLNGDGQPDIAVATEQAVGIWLATSDARYTPVGSYPAAASLESLMLADMNADGRLDLVTLDFDHTLSIRFGNGDGTFTVRLDSKFAAGNGWRLAAADLNGDGFGDLVTTTTSSIVVLLGAGDGTFAQRDEYAASPNAGPLALGDLDGDGHLDVVATGLSELRVLLGAGDGTFAARTTPVVLETPTALAISDLDRDGHPDIVVADLTLVMFRGAGDGTFACKANYLPSARTMALGDVNGDGRVDVAAPSHGGVEVLLNRGR